MNLALNGKRALVTGGCHGIGLAIANILTDEGCKVHSVCRHTGYDLSTPEGINKVLDTYQDVDILINNVGGGGRWKLGDYDQVYNKNIRPMVELTAAYLPYMEEQKWGRIITIGSIQGRQGGGRPGFAMAKAGQHIFMKTVPHGEGVTCNVVAPGAIWIDGKEQDKYTEYGQPEDVANVVAFLCSDKARWIDRACVVVDRGYSISL